MEHNKIFSPTASELEPYVSAANIAGYLESAEQIVVGSDAELASACIKIVEGYNAQCERFAEEEKEESGPEFAEIAGEMLREIFGKKKIMTKREFHDYIIENFNIDGMTGRLITNILNYIDDQGMDDESNYNHLYALLDGTIGLEEDELTSPHA